MKTGIVVTVMAILLVGCAGAKSKLYNQTGIRDISAWSVGFRYEVGSVEKSVSESLGKSETVIREGMSARDLQLRDDIVLYLTDNNGIVASDVSCDSCGHIALHPVSDDWGFVTVDAVISDTSGTVLARTKIKNGTRNATHKDDDGFAKFAAKKIAALLKSRQP